MTLQEKGNPGEKSFSTGSAAPLDPHALEERVAEDAVRLGGAVQSADAGIKLDASLRAAAIEVSRTPSIIAVKVFRVKPSTRSGRLESTYTIRGETLTSTNPAWTISG